MCFIYFGLQVQERERKVSKAHDQSLDDTLAENDEQTASYIQRRHLAQRMIMMAQQYANKQESGVVHTALGTFHCVMSPLRISPHFN